MGVLIICIPISRMRKLRFSWLRSHSKEEAELGGGPGLSVIQQDSSPRHVPSTLGLAKGRPAKYQGLPLGCGWGDEAQRGQHLLGVKEWGRQGPRCSPSLLSGRRQAPGPTVCSPTARANTLLRTGKLWDPLPSPLHCSSSGPSIPLESPDPSALSFPDQGD